MTDVVDVAVVGGGPGGYTAAQRCAARGLSTVLVEGCDLGGTCLNVGCIPSKAMIHVAERFGELRPGGELEVIGIRATPEIDLPGAVRWKNTVVDRLRDGVRSLLTHAGVHIVAGWARVVDGKTIAVDTENGLQMITARNLVLATGSRPMELPHISFGGKVVSSTEALSLDEVPNRLAVVGAGYIGLELGTAFAKLGSRVTVIEVADQILPMYDATLVRPVATRLRELGVDVRIGTAAVGMEARGLVVGGDDTDVIEADVVLLAVGRVPALDGWGVETLDLTMSGRFVAIDDRCCTSMRGVYAIGDITGEPMLAHRAMAQAAVVADVIAGQPRVWDHRAVPAVCFTDPELLAVGLSPEDAKAQGCAVVVGTEPFTANGRALTLTRGDGFVRVVADAATGQVLGIQAVGTGVSELAAEASTAIEMEATVRDLDLIMHAHPTLAESVHGAAVAAAARLASPVRQ
jgi:dihydrolipoyl dehydrogenase